MVVETLRYRMEEARQEEVSQLEFSCLADANCSSAEDKEKILQAIAGRESEVELALRTLMRQGMSTAELRRSSLRQGGRHDSTASAVSVSTIASAFTNVSATSRGYKDAGSAALALLLWPLYLYFSFWSLDHGVLDRVHFSSLCIGGICYPLCIWAHLNSDADLANLILRCSLRGLFCSIICGGPWAIAGGIAFTTCAVADGCHQVQEAEVRRFLSILLPLSTLCSALVCWELLAMMYWGPGCICTHREIYGIFACFMFLACGVHMAMRRKKFWKRSHLVLFCARMFAACVCGNSCLAAASLIAILTDSKVTWFLAEACVIHSSTKGFGLRAHCIYSSCCLLAAGLLCPAMVLLRYRVRMQSERGKRQYKKPSMELELSLITSNLASD